MSLPTYNNWTPVKSTAAQHLTTLTNSPGVIYPVGTNALPPSLQRMPGVCSYYISGYVAPQVVPHGFTATALRRFPYRIYYRAYPDVVRT
jgi:hypothetical protein